MDRILRIGLLWFLLLQGLGAAWAVQPVPPLNARVMDLAGVLAPDQKAALDRTLADFEQRKGSQIAVLILPTTQPESIEQYSMRVVEQWKLGRKKIDDGALLIVARNDRAMRIEVGYGLEGALNDAVSKRIISDIITPYFKRGEYYAGLEAGVQAMMRVIDGEPLPAPKAVTQDKPSGFGSLLPFLVIPVLLGGGLLRFVLGQFLGALAMGAVVAGLAWLFLHAVLLAAVAGLVAFFFTLLGGGRGMGGIWPGGMGGGGGFGSGGLGGGGFGGGGGGFGGGGASGRW